MYFFLRCGSYLLTFVTVVATRFIYILIKWLISNNFYSSHHRPQSSPPLLRTGLVIKTIVIPKIIYVYISIIINHIIQLLSIIYLYNFKLTDVLCLHGLHICAYTIRHRSKPARYPTTNLGRGGGINPRNPGLLTAITAQV